MYWNFCDNVLYFWATNHTFPFDGIKIFNSIKKSSIQIIDLPSIHLLQEQEQEEEQDLKSFTYFSTER